MLLIYDWAPSDPVGDRCGWLEFGPKVTRADAIFPLALHLGLDITDMACTRPGGRLPCRMHISAPMQPLPETCVYVGQGHYSTRLRRACWASPFVEIRTATA